MVSLTDATISLAIQITVLALLIIAWTLKNRKKFRQHGITMTAAVVLHIITILYVMIPSFTSFTSSPGTIELDPIVIISFIHVALGFITVALGIWLTASWHFKTHLQTCFRNKRLIKPTITLWFIAILLGVIMYITIWADMLLDEMGFVALLIVALLIQSIIAIIVLAPVLWIAGRLLAGKDKAKFTDAIWIAVLGVVTGAVVGTFLNGLVAAIIMFIIWLALIKHFFNCGWVKAFVIAVVAVIIFVIIAVTIAAIGIGLLLLWF